MLSETHYPKPKSIEGLIKMIDEKKLLLPEFQRDFRWNIEQSGELFDSLVRNIFIGSLILAQPKFPLSCREIDQRPRKGKGRNDVIPVHSYTPKQFESEKIEVLLDGQQRMTSLYRTLKGIGGDTVYFVFRKPEDLPKPGKQIEQIEEIIEGCTSNISDKLEDHFFIAVSDVYKCLRWKENKIRAEVFDDIASKQVLLKNDKKLRDRYFDLLIDLKMLFDKLLSKDTLLTVFILDMDLDKLCLFFERSNSKGISLNFIDIITAKIYEGFNLREKREEFLETHKNVIFDDGILESFVRYLSFLKNHEVDKKTILKSLDSSSFQKNWDLICQLYVKSSNYLVSQKYIVGLNYLPNKNMIIPIMHYLKNLPSQDFSRSTAAQTEAFRFWFYASLLNTRYGGGIIGSTNDIIRDDCDFLGTLAETGRIDKSFIKKIKFNFSFEELSDNGAKSAAFVGIMSLIHNRLHMKNWGNNDLLNFNSKVDVHHIFPKKYLEETFKKDDSPERLNYDSMFNKTYIEKIPNIVFGKLAPSKYLGLKELAGNKKMKDSLLSHAIPNPTALIDGSSDLKFMEFIQMRYNIIKEILDKEIVKVKDKLLKSK